MRLFTEITPDGTVRHVFPWEVADADPEFAPGVLIAVDVTGLDPLPAPGWTYAEGVFAPPPAPEPATP